MVGIDRQYGAEQGPARVGQVVGRFGGGGAERVAYNLAVALAKRGLHSTCIAVCEPGSYAQRDEGAVRVRALNGHRSYWSLMCAGKVLRQVVREQRLGLLHVHGGRSLVFCDWAMRGMRDRPRVWFTWHVPEWVPAGGGVGERMLRHAMGRAERVFAPSSQVAEQLSGCVGKQVEVFRNGVPVGRATRGMGEAEPTVVWVGRMVPTKDPQMMIRAAARLRARGLGFRLVMAGAAPAGREWFETQTRQLARELGVAERVEFVGWMDDGGLAALYQRAAVGVQSSRVEGLSMMLLEQMSCGLAVVATDVGDTRRVVEDGRTGLMVRARAEDELVQALGRVLRDGALRRALGQAARAKAMAEYSLEAMGRQVSELLAEVEGQGLR